MKNLSICLIVFTLTFCFGLSTVWTLNRLFEIPATGMPYSSFKSEESDVTPSRFSETDNRILEDEQVEYFTDDYRIGRRGRNKIEIRCSSSNLVRLAEIKFYTRTQHGRWLERQSFQFNLYGFADCNPVIEDFNNDGLNDFTYQSSVAARGSNEVRKLFVYDKSRDELIYIKNSEDYPNLEYNKKLDCIDAWAVHGTSTTIFLHIERDMLKEFANVNTGLERTVSVTGRNGQQVVVRREKMDEDDIYTRYSEYDPPRP